MKQSRAFYLCQALKGRLISSIGHAAPAGLPADTKERDCTIMTLSDETARRRTFAIISHPDAGKTTLTENLLLAAGAIHRAGEVAARGNRRRTTSDWMKIERERGISVSASVMTFTYNNHVYNLLDTPGHEDFSEDTYRTLTAVDCAVMVLDAARGIEPQTLKLFEVCRLRDIPIITFINKMDREARDPLELLDQIQDQLQLDTAPLYWPAASGQRFAGMLDLTSNSFVPYAKPGTKPAAAAPTTLAMLRTQIDPDIVDALEEGRDLARQILPAIDHQSFLEGHMTPVVFGTALRRFGVRELLDVLERFAPAPRPQKCQKRGVACILDRNESAVSGFVFKIQANMDPKHRDRIAFLRLCSGVFERGARVKTANGKAVHVHNPVMFLAQDREIMQTAYPGDIIGIPNHGQLRVGDSLSDAGDIMFDGIPNFAPEILVRARINDPMKAKHLRKALVGLAEEGVTQLFRPYTGSDMIVGAVGALQIDMMAERMASEYNLDVAFEPAACNMVRWVTCDDGAKLAAFLDEHRAACGLDIDDAPVYLAKNTWDAGYVQEQNPDIRFATTKERSG